MAGKRGAPKGNNNAIKTGKYAKLNLLTCNRCLVSGNCPSFSPGSICAYEKAGTCPSLENAEDILNLIKEVLKHDYLRYKRQIFFEKCNSGILDADTIRLGQNITKEAELASKLFFLIEDRIEDRNKESAAPIPLINITSQETNLQVELMEAIKNASVSSAPSIEPDRS